MLGAIRTSGVTAVGAEIVASILEQNTSIFGCELGYR
jgi:hypothetical protein